VCNTEWNTDVAFSVIASRDVAAVLQSSSEYMGEKLPRVIPACINSNLAYIR
jgi:hypothetical protein